MASVPADRLELLAAIKAHSQNLSAGAGATAGPESGDAAGAGSGDGGGGWSEDEWRGAFQHLVRAHPFAVEPSPRSVALSTCI